MISRLRELFSELNRSRNAADNAFSRAAAHLTRCDLAILMLQAREQRDKHFDLDIFGEPGWDILLDLYIAYCRGVAVDTSSACIAARVAPTTGLRWLNKLSSFGLIERVSDFDDARRVLCHLSDEGLHKVEEYLDGYTAWITSSYRPEPTRGSENDRG